MWALFKKEIGGFFSSLTGYLVIVVFLLLISLFMWIVPGQFNVIENGYATMDSLFAIAPWVFLFLVPAITMRMFSEEKRSRTLDLLYTRPVSELQIILAKFLASWVLVYNGMVGRSWSRLDDSGFSDGMSHRLGASFEFSPSLFIGLEGDWYLEHARGWDTVGRFVGPNLSVDAGRLWITASARFAFGSAEATPGQVFQAQVGWPF